jgi:hypothetical protein
MSKIKTKISVGAVAKYLRELSVVVIGIAITLSVNSWLTTRNEKKDMALYLDAVKMELEKNLEGIIWMTEMAEEEVNYSHYLLSHDKNALNPDSIRHYGGDSYAIRSNTIISNAFEMFKASGSMRFIKNKEILLSIWDAYSNLEKEEIQLDLYHNKDKFTELKKEMQLEKEGKPVAVPMYDFYTSPIKYSFQLLYRSKMVKSTLEETIAKIEEEL